MDEEDLSGTAIEGNCSSVKPAYGQSLGHSGSRQDEVSPASAEEGVHGFIAAAFSDDDKDEDTVSKESNQVGDKEGERSMRVGLPGQGRQQNRVNDRIPCD